MNAQGDHGRDKEDIDVKHGGRPGDDEKVLQEAVDDGEDESNERSLEQSQQHLGTNELVLVTGDVAGSDYGGADEWQRVNCGEQPCKRADGVITLEPCADHQGEKSGEEDAEAKELHVPPLELTEIFVEHAGSFVLN